MKFARVSSSVLAFLLPMHAANSASIVACGNLNSISNIRDPISENTRSYADGKFRVTGISTGGEPVCCHSHAIIEVLKTDEEGYECFRLSNQPDGSGYSDVFAGQTIYLSAETQGDSEGDLLFVPVMTYPFASDTDHRIEMIKLRVTAEKPNVTIDSEHSLTREPTADTSAASSTRSEGGSPDK